MSDDDGVVLDGLQGFDQPTAPQPTTSAPELGPSVGQVPAWVGEHLPDHELVMPVPTRRFRKPAAGAASPVPGRGGGLAGRGPMIALVGAAVLVVGAAGWFVLRPTGSTPVPAPVAETTAAAASEPAAEDAAASSWCSPVDGAVVGNSVGDRSSGPGVIQAFEYAYYMLRDAKAVGALMDKPAPANLQQFLNEVPLGTEHCVLVRSTPAPDRFDVDVLLHMPDGAEGVHQQTVTTVAAADGLKIKEIESRR